MELKGLLPYSQEACHWSLSWGRWIQSHTKNYVS